MNILTFEDAVEEIMQRTGTTRALAEILVANQMPHLRRLFPVTPTKDAKVLEKAEQVEIRKIAIAFGFKPYWLSQARATKQSPGIADLWLVHRRLRLALWWETKRQVGGALSPSQEEFREDCEITNTGYGSGDRYAFVEKLLDLEIAVRGAGEYGIEPVRHAAQVPV